jgi:hypothetical protein
MTYSRHLVYILNGKPALLLHFDGNKTKVVGGRDKNLSMENKPMVSFVPLLLSHAW